MKSKQIALSILSIITILLCVYTAKITSEAKEYSTSATKESVPSPISTSNVEPTNTQTSDVEPSNDSKETKEAVESTKPSPKATIKSTKKPQPTKKATKKPKTKSTKKPTTNTPKPTSNSTTSKVDAPIKIPTIYSVSAPGDTTYVGKNDTSIIDASNMNKGYIAVKYTGSNKKIKVQVKKGKEVYNYDLDSDGKYEYFPLQLGNGSYTVNVLENISGTQYRIIQTEELTVNISNKNNVFLYPSQYVWFTQSSDVVKKSAQLCSGQDTTIKKISAIFKYVTKNIKYDYAKAKSVQSGYLPDIDAILSSGTGICFDYAAVFAAMCRAQGIPTKLITGYVSPNGVYHAWNEVYTKEKGWITVSFYLDTIGYNLVDPTFYSNMDDSKEAAQYIGNGSNYQTYHIY